LTIFSGINERVEGPLGDLLGAGPMSIEVAVEWFAWVLSELRAEATRFPPDPAAGRLRFCYLIVDRTQGPGYVQFAAGADGSFISETSSNQSLGVDRMTRDDELLLEAMGWTPPASDARGPRPNFRVDGAADGRTAFMALRGLVDVFDVTSTAELKYVYFDGFRENRDERGDRVPPAEPGDNTGRVAPQNSAPRAVTVLPPDAPIAEGDVEPDESSDDKTDDDTGKEGA